MMTVGEVSKLTGVTVRALHVYDKAGLLCPMRTGEGRANNRRLYDEDDLDRLQKIVVLQEYGLELAEIGEVIDAGADAICEALRVKLDELRYRENRLRNLILFAKLVDMSDGELFECLACGPTDIDDLADAIRGSVTYQQAVVRLRSYSDVELIEILQELDSIIYDLMHLDEESGFQGVERQIDLFGAWWSEHVASLDEVGYLGFWAIFEDETIIAEHAESIGGQEVSASIQMFAFYVCMKRLMVESSSLVAAVAESIDSDVTMAIQRFGELAQLFVSRMGLYGFENRGDNPADLPDDAVEVCSLVIRYMIGMLEDSELMGFVDMNGEIAIEISALLRIAKLIEQVFAVEYSER